MEGKYGTSMENDRENGELHRFDEARILGTTWDNLKL
jgi:hypothetical protein